MKRRSAKPKQVTIVIPIRGKSEDLSRRQRDRQTEHIAYLLHAGQVAVTRK